MRQTKQPVYAPMIGRLETAIRQAELMPGDPLPSENELQIKYTISRVSVRRALAEMAARRLIVKRHGKGAFVADPKTIHQHLGSLTIGVSAPYARNNPVAGSTFFGPIYHGLTEAAGERHFRLLLVSDSALETMADHLLQGFVGVGYTEANIQKLDTLKKIMPVVLINRFPDDPLLHAVTIDHQAWARHAVDYLIQLGHRQIGLVSLSDQAKHIRKRLAGARDALLATGLPWNNDRVCSIADARDGHAPLQAFFQHQQVTAVFVLTGNLMTPVLTALHSLARRIPDDISVISFDDVPNPLYPLLPAISVIRQPLETLGRQAVDLIRRIHLGQVQGPAREIIPAELVIRESCRDLRQGNL